MAQKQSWNKMGGLLGGGPNPYGDFHRKDRIDFKDALLSPEDKKRMAIKGHFTGDARADEVLRKSKESEGANIANKFLKSNRSDDESELALDMSRQFSNKNRSDEERGLWDDIKEGASDLVEKGKGLLSQEEDSNIKEVTNPAFAKLLGSSPMMDEGSLGEAEGAEAADRRQQMINNAEYQDYVQSQNMTEDQKRMMGPEYQKDENVAAYVDEGESALDRIGAEDRGRAVAMADFKGEEEGEKEVTGKYQGDNQFGVLGEKLSGAYDSVKDWFGSGGEDSAEDKAGKKQLGAALMKGASGGGAQPPGGRMSMPTSKTVRGQVAFPGLLNKPKRQKNPYFMPKGLV